MAKRIDKLTRAQEAQMGAWADKWIEIGLRTGNADRALFEDAARRCYEAAGLRWHGNVVWVTSPLVLAIAAPTAGHILDRGNGRDAVDAVSGAVHGAVSGAVGDAVHGAVSDAVHGAVSGAVRGAVRGAVSGAVGDAVHGAVSGAVRGAVHGAVGDAVRGAVRDAVRDAVSGAVRDAVSGAVRGAVRDAVHGAVRDAVSGAVHGAVHGAVGDAVRDAVSDAVSDAVHGAVSDAVDSGWHRYIGGQFWPGGWWWGGAYTSFLREVCQLELDGDLWDRGRAYEDTIRSACWWWPHRNFVMVCERPTVIHREIVSPSLPRGLGSHRLHSVSGPAVGFRDGWGVYAVHGVRVPPDVIENNASITVSRIEAEQNAEVRRVMIDLYKGGRDAGGGPAAYLADSGAKILHEDNDLLGASRRLLWKDVSGDEPIVMIDVQNSTQEPNGAWKRYQLRVDPNAYGGRAGRECLAAIASTWRDVDGSMMFARPEDYQPCVET